MARLQPTLATIKALFAKSGNQCAFPGCNHVLVTDKNLFVGELCHIEAAAPGGPRYNDKMSDKERRVFRNLLVLCHRHHVEIDSDVETYTPRSLRAVKRDHEALFADSSFTIQADTLRRIQEEISRYWTSVERINRLEQELSLRLRHGRWALLTDGDYAREQWHFNPAPESPTFLGGLWKNILEDCVPDAQFSRMSIRSAR